MITDQEYKELMSNLHIRLLTRYGSILVAAEQMGINRSNLVRCLHAHQQMSVELWLHIMASLNGKSYGRPGRTEIGLRDYMNLPHDALNKSIIRGFLGGGDDV